MYYIFITGPAGCGKSYLTYAFINWLRDHGLDAISLNLDPAVDWLPYAPDVDIRDYIAVSEVMKKYGLGPNGALIASMDLLINYIDSIKDDVESFRPNYVVVDTPGQLEIFLFRSSGPFIISSLTGDHKNVVLFLIEAPLISQPSMFLSLMVLSLSATLSHRRPQVLVISKSDLLSNEKIDQIKMWLEDPYLFIQNLGNEPKLLNISQYDIGQIIDYSLTIGLRDVVFVSSITGTGFDNLYAIVQRILAGGEDYYTEEPSQVL